MTDLRLVADNAKPAKANKLRRLPKVSPRCPACNGQTWMYVNISPADVDGTKPQRVRCCVHCLAHGRVVTW